MSYINADGLLVPDFGESGITQKGGSQLAYGHTPGNCEIKLDYTDITATAAIPGGTTGTYGVIVPKGVQIEEVEIFVEEAFTSGGAATLDVGLKRLDRSTELDHNGLVAALALTSIDAKGDKLVLRVGSTGAGALIGTETTQVGILTVNYATAAYTAGKIAIRVKWFKPNPIG